MDSSGRCPSGCWKDHRTSETQLSWPIWSCRDAVTSNRGLSRTDSVCIRGRRLTLRVRSSGVDTIRGLCDRNGRHCVFSLGSDMSPSLSLFKSRSIVEYPLSSGQAPHTNEHESTTHIRERVRQGPTHCDERAFQGMVAFPDSKQFLPFVGEIRFPHSNSAT